MSNPYSGAVASALRKSELLLAVEGAGSLESAAFNEAALLQLWRAYRAFLGELAFQLQLGVEPETASELDQRTRAAGKACAEVGELVELLAEPDSWLSQLHRGWLDIWHFSAAERAVQVGQAQNLIPLNNLSTTAPVVVDKVSLQRWRAALKELVQRHRAHTEEW